MLVRLKSVTLFLTIAQFAVLGGSAHADDAKKPDSGKFNFTIQGMKAGSATFKFDAAGSCDADVAVNLGGQDVKIKLGVKAKSGKVTNVSASAGQDNKFAASLEGDKANVSINGDAAKPQTVPAGALPFGNFSPFLFNYMLTAYDSKKGGAQPFDMLLIEGLPNGQFISFKAKLSGKGTTERKISGKPSQVTEYLLTIQAMGTDIEMKLYADADRHLLAWNVPSQSYTAVREGFEDVIK